MLEPLTKRTEHFQVDNAFRMMRHAIQTKLNKSDCWEWQGGTTSDGFPVWRTNKLNYGCTVRRNIWRYCYNFINESTVIRAFCGNRLCVRPSHLYLAAHSTTQKIRNLCAFRAFQNTRIKPIAIATGSIPLTNRRLTL